MDGPERLYQLDNFETASVSMDKLPAIQIQDFIHAWRLLYPAPPNDEN